MMTHPLIQLKQLNKVFLTDEIETHALSDIDLTIHEGEYVSIAGPSGCGKSALLSILGLLDVPSSGHYLLKGKPANHLSKSQRAVIRNREVGFIFQSFNLISDMTVFDNIALPLSYRNDMSVAQKQAQVKNALNQVNMAHRSKHFPSQLSGGQQQRVAIARALAGDPSIILADEPTGNLDSKNAKDVMDLLDQLHLAGATICMVTHDPRSAERANRQVDLFDGKLVADNQLAISAVSIA